MRTFNKINKRRRDKDTQTFLLGRQCTNDTDKIFHAKIQRLIEITRSKQLMDEFNRHQYKHEDLKMKRNPYKDYTSNKAQGKAEISPPEPEDSDSTMDPH